MRFNLALIVETAWRALRKNVASTSRIILLASFVPSRALLLESRCAKPMVCISAWPPLPKEEEKEEEKEAIEQKVSSSSGGRPAGQQQRRSLAQNLQHHVN